MNNDNPDTPPTTKETCDLHVKRIPKAIWLKARQNALMSSLSFRDYIIRVLDECKVSGFQNCSTCVKEK